MIDHRTLLRHRSERGAERGAEAVWHDAATPAYARTPPPESPRPAWPLAATAAVLALIALSATVMLRSGHQQDAATLQPGAPISSTIPDPAPEGTEMVMVFFHPDDSTSIEQRYDELSELVADAEILAAETVDRDAAWEEFQELFGDHPDMIEAATPELLPESIRLLVPESSAEQLQASFQQHPAVFRVVLGSERGDGSTSPADHLDPDSFDTGSTSGDVP